MSSYCSVTDRFKKFTKDLKTNIRWQFNFLRINGALHLKSYWKTSFWTEKVPQKLSCMLHGGGFSRSDVSVLLESFRFVHIFEIQFFGRTRVQNRSWNFFSKYFFVKMWIFWPVFVSEFDVRPTALVWCEFWNRFQQDHVPNLFESLYQLIPI